MFSYILTYTKSHTRDNIGQTREHFQQTLSSCDRQANEMTPRSYHIVWNNSRNKPFFFRKKDWNPPKVDKVNWGFEFTRRILAKLLFRTSNEQSSSTNRSFYRIFTIQNYAYNNKFVYRSTFERCIKTVHRMHFV